MAACATMDAEHGTMRCIGDGADYLGRSRCFDHWQEFQKVCQRSHIPPRNATRPELIIVLLAGGDQVGVRAAEGGLPGVPAQDERGASRGGLRLTEADRIRIRLCPFPTLFINRFTPIA